MNINKPLKAAKKLCIREWGVVFAAVLCESLAESLYLYELYFLDGIVRILFQLCILIVVIFGTIGAFCALVSIFVTIYKALKKKVYIYIAENVFKAAGIGMLCLLPNIFVFNYFLLYIVGYFISCR